MKRILADFWAFGRQYMRSRVGAFFAFAFPLILILLFGAIFSGGESSQVPIHVQDLDRSDLSRAFLDVLNGTGVVEYRPIPANVAILDYISDQSINTALVIPEEFEEAILSNSTVNVTLYGDPTQSSFGIAYATVDGVAADFSFQVKQAVRAVRTNSESISVRELKFIDLFLPGVIGLTVLTNPLFGMTSVCAEYRTRKYFNFLATTTLSKGSWLAAKILFWIVIMLISTVIMLVANWTLFGGIAVITPMAILLIVAGTIEFTSLGMVIGLFVKDVETGAAVSNAIGFPMMFLGGSFFTIESMPDFLQRIAQAMPLTYLNEGLRATMVRGNEGLAFTYLLVTVGLALAFFVIPAKLLSWKSK